MTGGETRIFEVPEAQFGEPAEHLRRVIQALNMLIRGEANHHYLLVLDEDASFTVIEIPGIVPGAVVQVTAMDAAAADEASVWAEVQQDKVLVHHESKAGKRVFGVTTHG